MRQSGNACSMVATHVEEAFELTAQYVGSHAAEDTLISTVLR